MNIFVGHSVGHLKIKSVFISVSKNILSLVTEEIPDQVIIEIDEDTVSLDFLLVSRSV